MRIIVSVALILLLAPPRPFGREVVITFDDLPVGGIVDFSIDELRVITRDLIASVRRNQIPAIGFVNEAKLERGGVDARRVDLLRQWVDAGLELGNHSR